MSTISRNRIDDDDKDDRWKKKRAKAFEKARTEKWEERRIDAWIIDHGPEHEDSRGQVFPHASSRYVVPWNASLRNCSRRDISSIFEY